MTKKHDIMWFKCLDSTNNEAKRLIHSLDNLSVVAACMQTDGRGQGDHIWLSPEGENLLFSIVMKFNEGELYARQARMISDHTAATVVKFLKSYGIEAWIKQPNDIYVGNKKICGMLIENSLRGPWISYSIIGIGLNINQRNFDVNLPNPTSMVLETKNEAYDPAECLIHFMEIFSHASLR